MASDSEIRSLMKALSIQESGGNPELVNEDTGAYGTFQIMPDNWSPWAQEAGLQADAPRTPYNQDIVAYHKLGQYIDQFGMRGAARAWYAGPGSMSYSEEALNRKQYSNGNEYPSINEYVNSVMSHMDNGGLYTVGEVNSKLMHEIEKDQPVFYQEENHVQQEDNRSWFDQVGEALQDNTYDSFVWGKFRTAATLRNFSDDPNYQLTQEKIDDVQKQLGGDFAATVYVCQNAKSDAMLQKLLKMKKEDIARRERLENNSLSANVIGGIMSMMIDPTNFIPLLSAPGKVGRFARYASMFGIGAGTNVVDRALAQTASGYKQDYNMAAIMGGVANSLFPLGVDLLGHHLAKKAAYRIIADANAMSDAAKAQLKGKRMVNAVLKGEELVKRLKSIHDIEYPKSFKRQDVLDRITPDKNVYAVSKDEIQALGKEMGIEIPDNAKGIFDDNSGASILVKDNIKDADDALKVLTHEQAGHGLKHILSEESYKKLMDEVAYKLSHNPSGPWKRAAARANGEKNLEEVLGYLAEELKPSNSFMGKVKKEMDRAMTGMGVKTHLTDDEFYDLLKRGAEQYAETQQGFRVLSDGSAVMDGIHFSRTSMANPLNLQDAAEFAEPGVNTLKRNALWATPYSRLSISVSDKLRQACKELLVNPYMNEAIDRIPIQEMKQILMNQATPFVQNYRNIRDQWLAQQPNLIRSTEAALNFDEQVIQAWNAQRAGNVIGHQGQQFDPLVLQAIQPMSDMRDWMIYNLKNNMQTAGGLRPMMPQDWDTLDDEFFRFTDDMRRRNYLAAFPDDRAAMASLTEYAQGATAPKRDIIRQQIEAQRTREYEDYLRRYQQDHPNNPTGANDPNFRERPQPLTEDELTTEINTRCRNWAEGIVDMDKSRPGGTSRTQNQDGAMDFMRYRLPMDTSYTHVDSLGRQFCFDTCMRGYDFDRYIPNMLNRYTGEVALSGFFSHENIDLENTLGFTNRFRDDIDGFMNAVKIDLQKAVDRGIISANTMNNDIEALQYVLDKIRGIASDKDPKTYGDAFAGMLNSFSYARNGGQMAYSQLAEISGSIAYEGWGALADLLPVRDLRSWITNQRMGANANDLLEHGITTLFGEDMSRHLWQDTSKLTSHNFRDLINADTRLSRILDGMDTGAKYLSNFTSWINHVPRLTAHMIESARKQMLIDTIRWMADPNAIPTLRNPFSEGKLRAAGITNPDAFRDALRQYIRYDTTNAYGQAVSNRRVLQTLDIEGMRANNPHLANQLATLIDYQSMRCITQPSIATDNLLKESHPFWKVFFYFKDFTMRATHSQFGRMYTNREMDDFLSAGFSMLTNGTATLGLAYAKSKIKYGDDEDKRQKYMSNYADPISFMRNGFLRSSFASPLSTINDFAEGLGMSPVPTIRTTVSRYTQDKNFREDPSAAVGSIVTQLPAVKSGLDLGFTIGDFVMDGISDEDYFTQAELARVMSLFPGQNHLIGLYLKEQALRYTRDNTDIPKKDRPKRKRVMED